MAQHMGCQVQAWETKQKTSTEHIANASFPVLPLVPVILLISKRAQSCEMQSNLFLGPMGFNYYTKREFKGTTG